MHIYTHTHIHKHPIIIFLGRNLSDMFALFIFIQYHTEGPTQYIKKRKVWKERSKVPCSPSIPNLFFPLQISLQHYTGTPNLNSN